MAESIEKLERRIEQLRAQVREALIGGDRERARDLRRGLRDAERAWDDAVTVLEQEPPGEELRLAGPAERNAPAGAAPTERGLAGPPRPAPSPPLLLPLREQVHQALTLLTGPASPRLISAVNEALFAGAFSTTRLTSLRRDEERSFRSAPLARPYYVCAALTADLLAPVRGLLAVSTWPMERRVIGPLSPRVDYLTAAIQIADSIQRIPSPGPAAWRMLWRFAVNIPGGLAQAGEVGPAGKVDPATVAQAARAEMEIHADADTATRRSAAARARRQLGDAEQLFGSRLRAAPQAGVGA
jgi:hypothetical protein